MSKYDILKYYERCIVLLDDILTVNATDNTQIDYVCKYLFNKSYIGTYSSNDFPLKKSE